MQNLIQKWKNSNENSKTGLKTQKLDWKLKKLDWKLKKLDWKLKKLDFKTQKLDLPGILWTGLAQKCAEKKACYDPPSQWTYYSKKSIQGKNESSVNVRQKYFVFRLISFETATH